VAGYLAAADAKVLGEVLRKILRKSKFFGGLEVLGKLDVVRKLKFLGS
jgi:hypothetical protein